MDPAFFVDGLTEQRILQTILPKKTKSRILIINPNGSSVSIESIVKNCATHIRLVKNYSPYIIIFDREKRKESSDEIINEFCEALKKKLDEENIKAKFIVAVPDRMIENWIIADWENFMEYSREAQSQPQIFDGIDPMKIIKRNIPRYDKVTDGVKIFKTARCTILNRNSPSFSRLYDKIKHLNCDCYWLKKNHD